jgi:8-oxo-dGTP pyrophosphatase MutT (NUDIX family)
MRPARQAFAAPRRFSGMLGRPRRTCAARRKLVDALRREIVEEAGVTPSAFCELTPCQIPGGELRLYVVTEWSGGEPRLQGVGHSVLRWFRAVEASQLPDLAAPDLADAFLEMAKRELKV